MSADTPDSMPPQVQKAELAMKEAVEDVVKEHRRLGLPLAVWQDGKVVMVPPEPATAVAESPGRYRTKRPRKKT